MKNLTIERRLFYSNAYLYLALGVIITFIGFFPTYFSKLGETDALHHFHGVTGTLWMVVLIVQPMLYRFGNMRFHRILGWTSVFFAVLVVFGGIRIIQYMMQTREPSTLLYKFAFLDVFTLLPFALFVLLAIAYRKNTQYHARFMICTIFGPLFAAVTRVFFFLFSNWDTSITATFVLFELILLTLILDDKRSGTIRPPYVICLTLFVFLHVLIYSVGEWPWWQNLADRLAFLP